MYKIFLPAIISCIALAGCSTSKPGKTISQTQQPITTIAFGSCSDQKRPQPLWDDIVAKKPQVWVWLGDNIYGDSENMDTLKAKYDKQKSNPVYQQLIKQTSVIGVWDDHDYGVNDGGKEYPRRVESQQLMLDFMDVAPDSPLRKQKGAYSSTTYGPKGQRVKVILLDGRYFRDALKKEGKDNVPNPDGDLLGEEQWQWLEKQLTGSDADVHIIGCGIQFLPVDHPYEKWANFPVSRQRFLDLIAKTKPKGAMLISGDRHIAEVSKVTVPGLGYDLFDITSSGLTHVSKPHEEPNKYRVGEMVAKLNYGFITINWNAKPLTATVQINGDEQATHLTQEITF
ncbi:alkaline phosphatase D family protein [Dyadobacter sp. CY326]|uniref:alkaline phosphatase D family protein n=1 Tax=Dyadobacter sp. CY326 TaxID=2907300 RepID=UPI001F1A491C|nr:alkaline phosphatase D family protein [Dyadobacter sp. CY326]MCE7067364.1 alkaline phosphatase family protein [Dyadobacter sp. CY326]